MIKVNYCCCLYSLRAGCLVLFWLSLIGNCILLLFYLRTFIILSDDDPEDLNLKKGLICYFISSIISVIVFGQGLYGIKKHLSQYLNSCYYYYLYCVIVNGSLILLMVIFPKLFDVFAPVNLIINYKTASQVAGIVSCLISMASNTYFASVVKSLRDHMKDYNSIGYVPNKELTTSSLEP